MTPELRKCTRLGVLHFIPIGELVVPRDVSGANVVEAVKEYPSSYGVGNSYTRNPEPFCSNRPFPTGGGAETRNPNQPHDRVEEGAEPQLRPRISPNEVSFCTIPTYPVYRKSGLPSSITYCSGSPSHMVLSSRIRNKGHITVLSTAFTRVARRLDGG